MISYGFSQTGATSGSSRSFNIGFKYDPEDFDNILAGSNVTDMLDAELHKDLDADDLPILPEGPAFIDYTATHYNIASISFTVWKKVHSYDDEWLYVL